MKFCLIGKNIEYSFSPLIHRKIGEKTGLNIQYSIESCQCPNIDYLRENYDGFNVTVPFKEKIIPYVNNLYGEAEKSGSVNTVLCKNLSAYSTDGKGFLLDFERLTDSDFCGKKVCILGCGGAAKALGYAISEQNPEYIVYFSRNKKGQNIFPYSEKEIIKDCHVIINTTPVGQNDDRSVFRSEDLEKNTILYDLIYSKKTQLIKEAEKAGAKAFGALGMLVFQAILSQEIWHNTEISRKTGLEIIEELTK